jgi:hypothetical protein
LCRLLCIYLLEFNLTAAYASCVTIIIHVVIISKIKAAAAAVAVTFTLFMVLPETTSPLYGIPRFFTDYRIIMIIFGEFILSKY